MTRSEFRFFERLRVRWAEVDLQKIVFNGHYLTYIDTAVAGYWRALALPYHETMAQLQGDLYVRKATLEYLGSARYDDQLELGLRCSRIGNTSMVFTAAVFRAERCLVHGELVYVFADPASQSARPVPGSLRDVLLGFEAGQEMLTLRVGDWSTLGPSVRPLRDAVFVQEQGISADLVFDSADAQALHAVAFNRLGLPVACARLVKLHGEQAQGSTARLGRMAVAQPLRGSGVGHAVLRAILQAACEQGHSKVLLHAQASAVAFYRRAGGTRIGPEFQEAGLAHQAMVIDTRQATFPPG